MMATIPLDLIDDGQRLRGISEAQVEALVNSIADIGLLNPISVYRRKLMRGGERADGYGLVAGLHRKTACARMGLVEIEANILDLSDLECQIAECDENLCAPVLSPSERARFTARRKEAYEALHPETRHGANQHTRGVDKLSTPSFADDQAAVTGADARSVRRDAERGEKIAAGVLDLIKGTKLDTGVYLDRLKTMPDAEQFATAKIDLAALKHVANAPSSVSVARSKIDADVKVRAAKEVAEIIAEHVPGEWWDAVKANLYAAGASNIAHELTNLIGQSVMDKGRAAHA
jgi:ParB family chromosome partitioning protein